jgi:UMF1 family MFS transporter
MIKNNQKTIKGWAMYDWANSAYALVISTAVFPPFFASVAPDRVDIFGTQIDSNSLYSFSVSFAFILMALMVPMLSGIADYSGRRKIFLQFFTILGSLGCMSLYFFVDGSDVILALTGFVLGTIGFGSGIVFYNAYLPEIVTEDRYDKVSAMGYAYGYA